MSETPARQVGRSMAPFLWRAVPVWAVATVLGFLITGTPGNELGAFASTVRMLPTVLLLFTIVDRRLGRSWRKSAPTLAALVIVVGSVPLRLGLLSLGFRMADSFWAVLLFAVLALAVFERLGSARRRLARASGADTRLGLPDPVFFLLPLAVYLAIQPWSLEHRQPDGDEPYYLLITHSLAYDGDVDLANNYAAADSLAFMGRAIEEQPGDPRGENGELYSRHAAFLPAILAPAYRVAGRAGVASIMALFAATLAFVSLALARRLWPEAPGGALMAWAILAFSPPLLIYAHQAWIEVPAALASIVASWAALELRRDTGDRWPWSILILVLALACLVALKLRLVLVAIPLWGLAITARGSSKRGRMALACLPALALIGILIHNTRIYGNPLRMYGSADLDLYLGSFEAGAWSRYLSGGVGMFYDSAFGLFASGPIWWLILPAVVWLVRQRDRFLPIAMLVMVPYLAAVAPRIEWYGGWSPPFRYPLVFLPLLSLLLVPLLERRPAGLRSIASVLMPMTIVLAALWVVVPGTTYNMADGGSHWLHMASQQLGADVVRLFPSTVRPRSATLVWVLLSLAAVPLALIGTRGRVRVLHRRVAGHCVLLGLGLALAAPPWLAHALPTRVVEMEDVWMDKSSGSLYPDRWTPQRPAFRGAWMLASRSEVRVPLVPASEEVHLTLHARRRGGGPSVLQVRAGDRVVEELKVESTLDWQAFEIGPVDWPADAPLVLYCPEVRKRRDLGILVDRIELEWQ